MHQGARGLQAALRVDRGHLRRHRQGRHPRYSKTIQRTNKLYVHDEANDLNVGDKVRIHETRPL